MKYRVEDKYLIYEDQIAYIKSRLNECMRPDPNMKGGSYLIKSLYFDDIQNSGLAANEDGLNERAKFRIRTYDNSSSIIKLELKGKKDGFTSKEAVSIDKSIVDAYLKNDISAGAFADIPQIIDEDSPGLLKRLYLATRSTLMSPAMIVEYERTAYVESKGNVRITFDRNIGGSREITRFWEQNIHALPALPTGQHILEVKYDEFMPDYIRQMINTGSLIRTSFSKYYYTRNNMMI